MWRVVARAIFAAGRTAQELKPGTPHLAGPQKKSKNFLEKRSRFHYKPAMPILTRRSFLRSSLAAPAVVLSTSLMPISAAKLFLPPAITFDSTPDIEQLHDLINRAYRETEQILSRSLYSDLARATHDVIRDNMHVWNRSSLFVDRLLPNQK